ncbi:hypothetical protein OYT88_04605 [Sporolactobacillus sp. CQH2019]|uniref:hypothetical protein n=1 Tax=Sporolactobacillus sp. CQH2019 TaxID=3023512 RepID=UPI00236864C4|nr:hypothetical protein [Sporolactobacillus sp. CQH2019]MDD9147830.1 hypothetical protein [Sporolactobacillus sp. CQH2019]
MATLIFKKNNRVINAPDTSEAFYLNEGYDEVELDPQKKQYTVVKAAPQKTVPYADYEKLQEELAAVKAATDQPAGDKAAQSAKK